MAEQQPGARKDTRTRDRALFTSIGLMALAIAVYSHMYVTSDKTRLRRIMDEAAMRPAARALIPLGCRQAFVFLPSDSAQLADIHGRPVEGTFSSHSVLCKAIGEKAPTCDEVVSAYEKAKGPSPASFSVTVDDNLRCTRVWLDTSEGQFDSIPIPPSSGAAR